jgi:cyanate lyase
MSAVNNLRNKQALISRLITAKENTGKTFTQIAKDVGLTNVYTAQLFYNQAQLKPDRVERLRAAVPDLSDEDVKVMQRVPFRSYDPSIATEPLVYRMQEAVLHNGEAIHAICAEEFGDGIMSAIDIFSNVTTVTGKGGEKRVLIQLNGKFLPHIEQDADNNTAPTVE